MEGQFGNYQATYQNSSGAKEKTKKPKRSKNKKEKSSWYTMTSNVFKGMAVDYIADSFWAILSVA